MAPSVRRRQDWPTILASYLDQGASREFAWGSWDCCHAACGAVEAMTGINPLGSLQGSYGTQEQAELILGGHGLAERAENVLEELGFPQVHVLKAQRGDLVLVDLGEDMALGVVDLRGTHAAIAAISGGVAYLKLSRAVMAWRVG